ncbi:MAG TPA: hypothetical protein VIN04_11360, partial [Myxococcota bacterium]
MARTPLRAKIARPAASKSAPPRRASHERATIRAGTRHGETLHGGPLHHDGLARRRGARARAHGRARRLAFGQHLDPTRLLGAHDGEHERPTGRRARHDRDQVVRAHERLAGRLDHHVAHLHVGLRGGPARLDAHDQHAVRRRRREELAQLGGHRLHLDADPAAPGIALGHRRAGARLAGERGREREPERDGGAQARRGAADRRGAFRRAAFRRGSLRVHGRLSSA